MVAIVVLLFRPLTILFTVDCVTPLIVQSIYAFGLHSLYVQVLHLEICHVFHFDGHNCGKDLQESAHSETDVARSIARSPLLEPYEVSAISYVSQGAHVSI